MLCDTHIACQVICYFPSTVCQFEKKVKAVFAVLGVILDILFLSFSSIPHNKALGNKVPGNFKFLNISNKVAAECDHAACYNVLDRQTNIRYSINLISHEVKETPS
jgi:hypothetical protein